MPTKTKTKKASAAPEDRAQGHTPGPWSDRIQWQSGPFEVIGADGRSVAYIAWRESNDLAQANARLIAAAPDLLAVVRQYHAMAPSPESTAAIAKAEGRSV